MSAEVLSQSVDPVSDRAVYRQIADHLRTAITSGALAGGDQVPSESQLAEHYGVARMTARAALRILQDEGLLVAEHGRGVFVRTRPPVRRLASDRFAQRHRKAGKAAFTIEAEQAGSAPGVDSLTVTTDLAPPEVAARLALPREGRVVIRSRRYLRDGKPVETAVSYVPADLAAGTPIAQPNPGPGGIYARLEEQGHVLDRFTEEVTARMPSPEESRALRLPPGVPVFRLIRTAYDFDGRAVEVCDTVMAADAFVLEYDLPAS